MVRFLPILLIMAGCANSQPQMPQGPTSSTMRTACGVPGAICVRESPPSFMMGGFEDDYGIEYHISSDTWTQFSSSQYNPNAEEEPKAAPRPASRYHPTKWNVAGQYLIAQNDSSNLSKPGLWTRIDWMLLRDVAPFEWAFCLSAYEEKSAEMAENTVIADRSTPKTGCNGHPFSRMKAVK